MPTTHDLLRAAYEAEHLADRLAECEDAERDAIEAELGALLGTLADEAPAKLDALRAVALRLDAAANLHKEEAARHAARRKARESGAARCRALAEELVRAIGPTRTADAYYRLAAGPPAVVGPEGLDAWVEQGWIHVSETPDRAAAKVSLSSMDPAEWPAGFALASKESLRW